MVPGSIRRFQRVRVSASNESSGNANSSGLDYQKGETSRYQWLWHDYSTSPLDPVDPELDTETVQSIHHPASSYQDLQEASSDSSGSELSPEKEFLSYAKKVPKAQSTEVDLMESGYQYCGDLEEVYVLLFGVGEASTEGIYSLRSYCAESALHKETIVCFKSVEDAIRFSGLLEATMPHLSTVHTIQPAELVQFCKESGYACRLELEGTTLTPPEFNVGVTDWERSMKLRQGHYEVLDVEPDHTGSSSIGPSMKQETIQETKKEASQESRISDSLNMKIEDVREMLERLLQDD